MKDTCDTGHKAEPQNQQGAVLCTRLMLSAYLVQLLAPIICYHCPNAGAGSMAEALGFELKPGSRTVLMCLQPDF